MLLRPAAGRPGDPLGRARVPEPIPGCGGDPVGPDGERQWLRLRRQIDLADGPWIAFVFSVEPTQVEVLRRRTGSVLLPKVRSFVNLRAHTPLELYLAFRSLLKGRRARAPAVWLDVIGGDYNAESGGAWRCACKEFLLRLDKRRDRLRQAAPHGLILALPADLKPLVRSAAPDLWSVRSLVVDLVPRPVADRGGAPVRTPAEEDTAQLTLAEAEGAVAEGHRQIDRGGAGLVAGARSLVVAASAFRSLGQGWQARATAERALAALDSAESDAEPGLRAEALSILASCDAASGDIGAGIDHAEAALAEARRVGGRAVLRRISELAALLGAVRRLDDVRLLADESLTISRRIVDTHGETPESLRDLSVSLKNVGDVRRALGDCKAASAAFEEALTVVNRLIATWGPIEEAETLRGHIGASMRALHDASPDLSTPPIDSDATTQDD